MSGIMLNVVGGSFAAVPGAPTIGTATVTSNTTATVAYTAPASNGGSVITSYTATSSPGGLTGTLSQAGSGTITVTGLTPGTTYTFTVTATNAIGTGPASASSNSIVPVLIIGQAYEGGYYAGQISTAGNGVADYNLVVGPLSGAQVTRKWAESLGATSGTSSTINGPANTNSMYLADPTDTQYRAAYFCETLNLGGYTDWYMPAKNELEICYYNLKPTTDANSTSSGTNTNAVPSRGSNYTAGTPAQTSALNFRSGGSEAFTLSFVGTWASTQFNNNAAWYQWFDNGSQSDVSKDSNGLRVRAVRRVPV